MTTSSIFKVNKWSESESGRLKELFYEMSTRRSLYHAFCLASSVKEVAKGSWCIGSGSLRSLIETSTLTRPILSKYQWFYDRDWEAARKLSEEVRTKQGVKHGTRSRTPSAAKKGIRHYSTRQGDVEVKASRNKEVC